MHPAQSPAPRLTVLAREVRDKTPDLGLPGHLLPFPRSATQLDGEDVALPNLAAAAQSVNHVKAESLMPCVLAVSDMHLKTRGFLPTHCPTPLG